MKTKIIPFDLETAKKIQAGEIKGCVKDKCDIVGTIVTFNGCNTPLPIVVKFSFPDGDNIFFVGNDGVSTRIKLFLEVPDNEPQFKPFDKVLVRRPDDYYGTINNKWVPAYYQLTIKENGVFGEVKHLASGILWKEILPFEGNEHLVGTTDKPKEE